MEKIVRSLLSIATLLSALLFRAELQASTAIAVGTDYVTAQPVVYATALDGSDLIPIALSGIGSNICVIKAVAVAPNGTAILVGNDYTTSSPLVFTLEAGQTQLTLISTGSDHGILYSVAIAADGTAFLGGQDGSFPHRPLLYRLAAGSRELTPISTGEDQGSISKIAIGSNNSVIAAGQFASSTPLIYRFATDGTGMTTIGVPGDDHGAVQALVVASDGTAILAGQYESQDVLVYKLAADASNAVTISIPDEVVANGMIKSMAVGLDNVAVMVGQYSSGPSNGLPIIYKVATDESTITPIATSGLTNATLNAIATDSDNKSVLVGNNIEGDFSFLAYTLTQELALTGLNASFTGTTINSVAIAPDGTAVFGGQDIDNAPAIYTLAAGATEILQLNNPAITADNGVINYVAIAGYDLSTYKEPYSIDRLLLLFDPIVDEATEQLTESGLL